MDPHDDLDDLIRRLHERVADPDRRVDCQVSAFSVGVAGLDVGSLLAQLGRAQADVARAMAAGPEGPPADLVARAAELAAQMGTPAEPHRRAPATPDQLDAAEAALGLALPAVLRRALGEVADGGFGPAYGLHGTEAIVRETAAWRADGERHATATGGASDWPAGLVVLADLGGGASACADLSHPSAPVLDLDPSELEDEEAPITEVLAPLAPSLVAWLDAWVRSPSPAEQEAASLRQMAAEAWSDDPQDELSRMRNEWLREQGLAPPG